MIIRLRLEVDYPWVYSDSGYAIRGGHSGCGFTWLNKQQAFAILANQQPVNATTKRAVVCGPGDHRRRWPIYPSVAGGRDAEQEVLNAVSAH